MVIGLLKNLCQVPFIIPLQLGQITHPPRQHFFENVSQQQKGEENYVLVWIFQDFLSLSSQISLSLFLWIHHRAFFSSSTDDHFVLVSILTIFVSTFSFFLFFLFIFKFSCCIQAWENYMHICKHAPNMVHVKIYDARNAHAHNDLVVKVLDSQYRGPMFKTTGWLQGRLSLSSFRGR